MWIYILIAVALLPALRYYFNGPLCKLTRDLRQKIVIITGANTGIGRETARALAEQGATLVLACRTKSRTQELLDELHRKYGESKILFMSLDLSDLNSVRQFVADFSSRFRSLDILINNAGVMSIPKRQLSPQGIEMQFATNHIGHFALTLALKPLLLKSQEARVITVSSMAHLSYAVMPSLGKIFWDDINFDKGNYWHFSAYSQSKLANILFAKQLQKVLDVETQAKSLPRIKSVSLHPGAVQTELDRHAPLITGGPLKLLLFKDAQHGASTTLQTALENIETLVPGGYYADCVPKKSSKESNDPTYAERLWKVSLDIVRQKGFGDLVEGF